MNLRFIAQRRGMHPYSRALESVIIGPRRLLPGDGGQGAGRHRTVESVTRDFVTISTIHHQQQSPLTINKLYNIIILYNSYNLPPLTCSWSERP